MRKMFFLLCVVSVSISINSCGNQSNYNTPTYTTTQSNNESSEATRVTIEESKSNPIDRFVGMYIVEGGDYDYKFEVLSDGRVIKYSRIISSGEETKNFLGDIMILSDRAFGIDAPWNATTASKTPIYVMRNGVEHEYGKVLDGATVTNLVFDISERRAYMSSAGYKNRDIGESQYVKFRH